MLSRPEELQALRELASERFLRNNGMELPVDNIALTAGSMQAISLICQAYIRPGDTILVEEYCYVGSLNCFRKYEANMIGVKIDDQGMNIDDLELKLDELKRQGIKPKFVYVIASNQNPTGTMMPESRRRRLVEVAKAHDVLVAPADAPQHAAHLPHHVIVEPGRAARGPEPAVLGDAAKPELILQVLQEPRPQFLRARRPEADRVGDAVGDRDPVVRAARRQVEQVAGLQRPFARRPEAAQYP
jgi:hypothetical protein